MVDAAFNAADVRELFPALKQMIRGQELVYLDSAATSLKPLSVIERIKNYYSFETANVHRGAHYLADAATAEFEKARNSVRTFINAQSTEEIIFTSGTTEGINLVAQCYGSLLNEGDEIVLTEMEHHSNIVPWQVLAQQKKCVLKYIAVQADGSLDEASIESQITEKCKIVAFTGCSNILGTLTPVAQIVSRAKKVGAVTLMDGAQYVLQKKTDVQALGIDFLVFSMHKLFGPSGFGLLYGRRDLLEKMPPYRTGGSMITKVDFQKSDYNILPHKFEAGTPHIEGAIATQTALEFFRQFPVEDIFSHEQSLMRTCTQSLKEIKGIRFFGTAADKAAIVSFNLEGVHHSDVGQILDQQGIAVRVGHHCTQPLLSKFSMSGTVRASFSIYNNEADVNRLLEAVRKAQRMLQ
jgi:cysteine desulfurase/selenocysteine lyase